MTLIVLFAGLADPFLAGVLMIRTLRPEPATSGWWGRCSSTPRCSGPESAGSPARASIRTTSLRRSQRSWALSVSSFSSCGSVSLFAGLPGRRCWSRWSSRPSDGVWEVPTPLTRRSNSGSASDRGTLTCAAKVEDRRSAPTGDRRRQIILGDVAALHLDGRIETLLPAGREVIDDEHLCTKPGERADEMVSYEARTTRHHDPLAVVVR